MSPVVIYYATLHKTEKTAPQVEILRDTAGLSSYLGLFELCKIFFGLHINGLISGVSSRNRFLVYIFIRAYIYNRRAKRRDFTICRQRFLNVPLRHL